MSDMRRKRAVKTNRRHLLESLPFTTSSASADGPSQRQPLSLEITRDHAPDMNDSATEIDALDCKADLRHFERLFRYVVRRQAQRHGMTVEALCELVPESELRRAVRKAV